MILRESQESIGKNIFSSLLLGGGLRVCLETAAWCWVRMKIGGCKTSTVEAWKSCRGVYWGYIGMMDKKLETTI